MLASGNAFKRALLHDAHAGKSFRVLREKFALHSELVLPHLGAAVRHGPNVGTTSQAAQARTGYARHEDS